AVQFVEDGWSVKKLVRAIVLSRTYRQAAQNPDAAGKDPENRWLARQNRRRLDAESLRDTILAVSSRLQPCPGGPTFPADLAADFGFKHADTYRSVYTPAFRNVPAELLDAVDAADPSMVTGRRNASTVAPQALVMMNHPFVIEQARHAARRVLAEAADDDGRTTRAYRLTLGRAPTEGERRVVREFLGKRSGD